MADFITSKAGTRSTVTLERVRINVERKGNADWNELERIYERVPNAFSRCKLSPILLDTTIQGDMHKECKTPACRLITPMNRLRPAGPLPSGTPESDVMTPGLLKSVNRKNIDCYVHRLKKRKFGFGRSMKTLSQTPLSKKPKLVIQSKSFDFESYRKSKTYPESDSCEDGDYYWSDVE